VKPSAIRDNERWLLSFYRHSEISGALFFGRLARSFKPGPIQRDMTHHFADESQHARYWTAALEDLGTAPVKIGSAYQDLYLEAAGLPTNMMEVLAITQVFEVRVIGQYLAHSKQPELHPVIGSTIKTIMKDEKWHIKWVGEALKGFEGEYGKEGVAETIARYRAADQEVYRKTLEEHEERLRDILEARAFLARDPEDLRRNEELR
jgi:hypothetical protein